MKVTQICRQMLPALTFACAMGIAPLALAQTGAPASSPIAAPAGTMAPVATPASSKTPEAKPATAAKLAKSDEFSTVALATTHCPGDTVVWSSLSTSHSYHLASSKLYGKTKRGAYVCKADATSAGFHLAKD
jgi:hypothetical protein